MVALRMLARLGASAVVAKDGQEAVAAVAEADFDLILMDVHMPRMDGVTATREISDFSALSGRPRPRIVAVTANALDGDSERLLAAGMDGYLSKPVTLKALGTLLTATVTGAALPQGRDHPSNNDDQVVEIASGPVIDRRSTR
jgi:CheY-like chemotaxis protein